MFISAALIIPFMGTNSVLQEDRIIYLLIRRCLLMTSGREDFAAKLEYHKIDFPNSSMNTIPEELTKCD